MKRVLIYSGSIFLLILVGGSFYFSSSSMENMPEEGKKSGVETGMPVQISPEKRQMIGVKTGLVEKRSLDTIIHAAGTVDYNEKKISQIQLRVSGWIKELYVNSTGQQINKGEPLFQLYSPDLFATKQEYLLAKETFSRIKESPMIHVREGVQSQIESARARLLLWNLTEEQIDRLDEEEDMKPETVLYSPVKGFVTKKAAVKGQYVTPEMVLYEIADISSVWVYADIYESDLGYIQQNQQVMISFTAYPDKTFSGKIIYISPNLSPETRTVKARIELPNPGLLLKPGMYGDVDIHIKIPKRLVVPVEAVIDSGMRQLAFLDRGNGIFEPREVKLGAHHEGYIEVVSGLKEGDPIVTSATFLIDSESKLMSAANMMGALGMGGVNMEKATMGKMETAGMDMKGMDMGGMEKKDEIQAIRSKKAGPYVLNLELTSDPPRVGEDKISLKITNNQNQIIRDAEVIFSYTMTMPGMMVEEVKGSFVKDTYEGKVKFAMAGGWKIEVLIKKKGQPDVKESFIFNVK
ncbi:MAG: efflux RND transporter periplasmic adaptor subunit [Nitrospirae bacterium]|nr:efflux RND transporter periplasmic adaptor subunit [Nitrospirota bacterium]MBI3353241.1 efflux RND transporter periplasmic adaptor subunit [Nitrospirota bacterium]